MAATLSLFRTSDVRSQRPNTTTVAEPTLFYAPPYATPDHDSLAWALVRALAPACGLRSETSGGTGFVVEMDDRSVGIRIADDAENGPDAPATDADVQYTFTRADISERLNDCLYVMALLDPAVFASRERIRLRRESSENLAIEFSGDRRFELTLRYEEPEQLVQIEDEWVVLDPDELTFETRVVREDLRLRHRLAV